MFSFLRNHSLNLPFSERFYYDNYDYYNSYENIENLVREDLSKFNFHCSRKSCPIIVSYTSNPKNLRFQHPRVVSGLPANTMEGFLQPFILNFIENNYQRPQRILQSDPLNQQFIYLEFGSIQDKNEEFSTSTTPLLSLQDLNNIIGLVVEATSERIKKLQQQFQDETLDSAYLECLFHFQLYALKILQIQYGEGSAATQLLYEFTIEVHRLMWDILNCRLRSILLLAQPFTPFLNNCVHPLTIPITTFLKYDHRVANKKISPFLSSVHDEAPRIVFVNLDGQQNAHNLRNIKTLTRDQNSNLLYISLCNEPSWLKRKETRLDNEENGDITFERLCQIYSQELIKEFGLASEQAEDPSNGTRIILFPLNSPTLYRKYLQSFYQQYYLNDSQKRSGIFGPRGPRRPTPPLLETSQDIYFLFEQIIFEQVRSFRPTMVFLSYNGQLCLTQEHFTDIVRQFSILSDHRVILFSNLTGYFCEQTLPITHEILQEDGFDETYDRLLCVNDFFHKYFEASLANVNLERMFANLSLFLKYAPGLYNMEDKNHETPFSKFGISNRYNYLEALSKIKEFRFLSKYSLQKWSADDFFNIYQQSGQWEIKQNKKESEYYEKVISTVISEFLCESITEQQLRDTLNNKLFYQRSLLAEELSQRNKMERSVVKSLMMGPQAGQQMEEEEQESDPDLLKQLFQEQLERKKDKLLLENQENYRTKKYYHLMDNQKAFGHVSCFNFTFGQEEGEEISMQKYSQVIVNEEQEELFIINYRSQSNRHMILSGSIKNGQIDRSIVVSEVKIVDSQLSEEVTKEFKHHHISEEGLSASLQDIVYVQYNHCINRNVLYLFWPLEWNIKDEVRCKMLQCDYKPKRVFKMLRVSPNKTKGNNECRFNYENIFYERDETAIMVLPRWGCACYATSERDFIILGGIFDSEDDYLTMQSGISKVKFNETGSTFTIRGVPKTKPDKYVAPCLRSKINYTFKDSGQEKNLEYSLILSGGYGRQGTAFFNLFSYDSYEIDLKKELLPRAIYDQKICRRLVSPERPLVINKMGKFNVVSNNHNLSISEEIVSDAPKEKFVFERNSESISRPNEWDIMAFVDENYEVNEFKTDSKKMFLFGFNRTIREKIYSKCWSPELYIVDGLKECIANLNLKTEKNSNYWIANYLMPKEEHIVSLCFEEDKIFLLSNSSLIHSGEGSGAHYVLYEGSFSNMGEVLRKREIYMGIKFKFTEKQAPYLDAKTVFAWEEKIYIVGGLSRTCENGFDREDYILEKNKNKMRAKTRRIQCPYNVDMPHSVVIQCSGYYLLYSLVCQDTEQTQMTQQQEEGVWKVKIEKNLFDLNMPQGCQQHSGLFKAYFYNKKDRQVQRYPKQQLQDLKFVSITPYERFNLVKLREGISKIIWRIEESTVLQNDEAMARCLKFIRELEREKNDKKIEDFLIENQGQIFEEMITIIRKRSDENSITYFEEEQLKDIKLCYNLVSKFALERLLHLEPAQPNCKEYRFVVEDRSSKKIKYIAVGPLGTTAINFFRIRFSNELSFCLNQSPDDFFYFPMNLTCEKKNLESLPTQDSSAYSADEVQVTPTIALRQ